MLVRGGGGAEPRWRKSPLKGFPDIMGWLNDGTPFYIEVKSDDGRLRKEQKEWAEFFSNMPKTIYILARTVMEVATRLDYHERQSRPQEPQSNP